MSLQGSFETISLADVMALLASSHKSGELRVVGGNIEGRLWIRDGLLVSSKVGRTHRPIDVLFELLRLTEGNFIFKDGVDAAESGEPTPVEPLVRQAQTRLVEWRDIEAVIPSVEHRVRLIPELPAPEVTVSAEEWRLVMATALAGTVHGVLEELDLGLFDGCQGLRRLVDAGLVIVDPPRVRPPAAEASRLGRRLLAANGTTIHETAGVLPSGDPAPEAVSVDLDPVAEVAPAALVGAAANGFTSGDAPPAGVAGLVGLTTAASVDVAPADLSGVAMPAEPGESLAALVAAAAAAASAPGSAFGASVSEPAGDSMPASVAVHAPLMAAPVVAEPMVAAPVVSPAVGESVLSAPASAVSAVPAPLGAPATGEAVVARDVAGRDVAKRSGVEGGNVEYPTRSVPGHLTVVRTLPQPVAAQVGQVTGTEGNPEPAQQEPEGDSINRGLLLKFLSSVRS